MSDQLALLGGPRAITRSEELAEVSRWPVFGEEEQQACVQALASGNPYTETPLFEEEFRAYIGTKYAVPHCNGTSSIHAAYFAVGVGPGDEVLTSAYTWHLGVSQILALHALPVFVDIDPVSANLDPEDLERRITPRTKAISVVHAYGCVAPMDEIMEIARAHDLPVVEDCSHAHGATYKGRKVGTIGDIGCFSLQGSKLMTVVEGGILVTDNEEYHARVCALAHYERIPGLELEEYSRLHNPAKEQAPTCFGFKYRIHPLAAAIGRVQLRHLEEWNATRRHNLITITRGLQEVGQGVFEPPYEAPGTERTWLNYIGQYYADKTGVPRAQFIEALKAEGLPATGGRTGYLPVYWNPLYQEQLDMWGEGYPFHAPAVREPVSYERGTCPQAESYWTRTVGLPVLHWPASAELLDEVIGAVGKVVANIEALKEAEVAAV